jgi:hypothetical protein
LAVVELFGEYYVTLTAALSFEIMWRVEEYCDTQQ